MTIGMPGTGIGGMFYVLSALAMPLAAASRWARRRRVAGNWRVVLGQTVIAGGVVGGMWAVGWLLEIALAAGQPIAPPGSGPPAARVLRMSVLYLGLGTLVAVLVGVELLRLWVHRSRAGPQARERHVDQPGDTRSHAPTRRRRRRLVRALLIPIAVAAAPHAASQRATPPRDRLARADTAYAAGDATTAEREYAAVLLVDPENSRATYRLAGLRRRNPNEALQLFRRYVELEPQDPWGYMAVGDALARAARYDEGVAWYDAALRLAPGERDAVVGRARLLARARRTGAAVAAYRAWLARHPDDTEAQGELVQVRVAAAASIAPLVSGSRDSDGNSSVRLGAALELPTPGPVRFAVAASREQVRDRQTSAGLDHLALRAAWQRGTLLRVEGAAGASRLDPAGHGRDATAVATGRLRMRWRALGGGPAIDVRLQRHPLGATPLLVANRVVRTELGGTVELPVARPVRLRGIGRLAGIDASTGVNHRTMVGGAVTLAAAPGVEVSLGSRAVRYSHPSTAGYFAPRLAQAIEVGTYVERETAASAVLALDAGVGLHRIAEHGAGLGPWRRALRLYALASLPLAPGRRLELELEGEDSPVAHEGASGSTATTAKWRYGSARLGLRWALR